MLDAALARMQWIFATHIAPRADCARVLDIGRFESGEGAWKKFFVDGQYEYIGLPAAAGDEAPPETQYAWLEIADASFDVVLGVHVFCHIPFFWRTVSEAARVLRTGGLLCLIEPRGLGRHRTLSDCYRFDRDGMAALADYAGLDIMHVSSNLAPPGASDAWFAGGGLGESMLVAQKPERGVGAPAPDGRVRTEEDYNALASDFMGQYVQNKKAAIPPSPPPDSPGEGVVRELVTRTSFDNFMIEHVQRRKKGSGRRFLRIAIVGTCQAILVRDFIRVANPDIIAEGFFQVLGPIDLDAVRESDVLIRVGGVDLERLGIVHRRVIDYPDIVFQAFHPDLIGVAMRDGSGGWFGPYGNWHSRIVLESFFRGYAEERCKSLFRHDVYARLGYYNVWDETVRFLGARMEKCGLDLANFLPGWIRNGCFMYIPNHPKIEVVADVMRALFERNNIPVMLPSPGSMMGENGFANTIFPVYPEIAAHLRIPGCGGYVFKNVWPKESRPSRMEASYSLTLDEYIHLSYSLYRNTDMSLIAFAPGGVDF